MHILVPDKVSAAGVELLERQPGWRITVSNPKEFTAHLADADALLVRSATKVTREVLEKAPKLRVIGRAGVGVDNVDLDAATQAGVLVMNTPGGNAVSVAEHTLALMLAMARAIPAASASTKSGRWEKNRFLGRELRGKTLGLIGLGSIGREVVRRAQPFGMSVIAVDPYVSSQIARDLNVRLVSLDELLVESDYISLHVGVTPETEKLLNKATFAKMKKGVRIVNCARGELIDEAALQAAIEDGTVAGAALDVFQKEPPETGFPLFETDDLLATPHIAGSTEESQEAIGVQIVEQVVRYLQEGIALNAVNMPSVSPEQYKALGPYIDLAQRLGRFTAYIAEGRPKAVRVIYSGKIADMNTQLMRNAGLAGVLSRSVEGNVNLVNAMQIAGDRGLTVSERHSRQQGPLDSVEIEIETDEGVSRVEGICVFGKPRLIQVDGIFFEAPLTGKLLYMRNTDVPGVIGHIGSVLGQNQINIASFSLGRPEVNASDPLEAISVIETDEEVAEAVLDQLRHHPAVKVARTLQVVQQSSTDPPA